MLLSSLGRTVARQCAKKQSFAPTALFKVSYTSESHDDFAPKKKIDIEDEDEAQNLIAEHVADNKIMLYMKGNPSMPQCGFSARVVQALQTEGVDFASVNVLDYPEIREGVKKFSEWPTIPQLYVNGEFIGGCDIVMSMQESGELGDLLKDEKSE
mmetsp:Transcript_1806/g.2486  ORF Transcript_1806/g.2486 Transcript_1806/m.2486 type:complete len:155 (+) Transcript_1806:49-513(+)